MCMPMHCCKIRKCVSNYTETSDVFKLDFYVYIKIWQNNANIMRNYKDLAKQCKYNEKH